MSAAARPLFRFVGFEYPWALGPLDGRYVIRGHAGAPAHVLMLATLGAAQRRRALGRRRRGPSAVAPAAEPMRVVTARATVVAAEPFGTQAEARSWREEVEVEREAADALQVLNRVLHLHRVAAADPSVRELALTGALAIRVGVGEGEALAHGRWTTAVALPPHTPSTSTARSAAVLRPQERLAAVLAGRDVALACEELALRARADVNAHRQREAALQLRIALEGALAELAPWGDRPVVARHLQALRAERTVVGAAANMALDGGLDATTADEVVRVLEALEAALRARTTLGLE